MSILGLSKKSKKLDEEDENNDAPKQVADPSVDDTVTPADDTNAPTDDDAATTGDSNADEAKAILEKMEAKKDAGDCPFC